MHFKAGKNWRRRFAKRHGLCMRKKTNCKNTTWEDTKPVLQRYFRALRRRLQLNGKAAVSSPPATARCCTRATSSPSPTTTRRWSSPTTATSGWARASNIIDEEDDEDEGDEMLPFEVPDGFKVAEMPPSEEQLEFKNAKGAELEGKSILYFCMGRHRLVRRQDHEDQRRRAQDRARRREGELLRLL